jgi:hypothetical protein
MGNLERMQLMEVVRYSLLMGCNAPHVKSRLRIAVVLYCTGSPRQVGWMVVIVHIFFPDSSQK